MAQFSAVSSKFGAPMGRTSTSGITGTATLFKVVMVDGDYDDGGAYWGGGEDLWCLRGEEGDAFLRAKDRFHAAAKFKADHPKVKISSDLSAEDVDSMVAGYVECVLFTGTDDNDDPLDENCGSEDMAAESMIQIRKDCEKFLTTGHRLLTTAGIDMQRAGQCFVYDRNGHGTGFQDEVQGSAGDLLHTLSESFGEFYPVVGDDGKIHV